MVIAYTARLQRLHRSALLVLRKPIRDEHQLSLGLEVGFRIHNTRCLEIVKNLDGEKYRSRIFKIGSSLGVVIPKELGFSPSDPVLVISVKGKLFVCKSANPRDSDSDLS